MDDVTLQLMTWVSDRPRTYGEVMEAWTTTCPKMPIWEDAVSDGLVRVEGEGGMRERAVRLTERGRALLNGHS
jgi:DNA-binding PadR family transcriptional regulator